MWRSKDHEEAKLNPVKCPVCPAILGKRNKNIIFAVHCEECRATFTWQPLAIKPTVIMDKDIKKGPLYCDKSICYCRS